MSGVVPMPSPPASPPASLGCAAALWRLSLAAAAIAGLVRFYQDRDPAWLAVSLAAIGAR